MSVELKNTEYFFKLRRRFQDETYGEGHVLIDNMYYVKFHLWIRKNYQGVTLGTNYRLEFESEKDLTMFLLAN